jgi:hypothetical protein
MNELIKKFSNSALNATKENVNQYPEVLSRLIINECIKACLTVYNNKKDTYRSYDSSFNEGFEIASIQCIQNIKDIFDIK